MCKTIGVFVDEVDSPQFLKPPEGIYPVHVHNQDLFLLTCCCLLSAQQCAYSRIFLEHEDQNSFLNKHAPTATTYAQSAFAFLASFYTLCRFLAAHTLPADCIGLLLYVVRTKIYLRNSINGAYNKKK